MGRAKQDQIEYDGKVQEAIGLCIKIGAIEECDLHPGEYIDTLEYLDMDELTDKIVESDLDAIEKFDSRDEMSDCIRGAMASAGEECGYCAKSHDSGIE
jgi:hypothetical protein